MRPRQGVKVSQGGSICSARPREVWYRPLQEPVTRTEGRGGADEAMRARVVRSEQCVRGGEKRWRGERERDGMGGGGDGDGDEAGETGLQTATVLRSIATRIDSSVRRTRYKEQTTTAESRKNIMRVKQRAPENLGASQSWCEVRGGDCALAQWRSMWHWTRETHAYITCQ